LKVIYDAAHSFGVKCNDTSVLNFGDISTLSFHATKLFHTVEGGAIVTNDDELAHRIGYMRNFGHKGQEDFWGMGVNGKNSEFHAAMGLCVLSHIESIIATRKLLSEIYEKNLSELGVKLIRPHVNESCDYNFSYYPVVFESESQLLMVKDSLNAAYIYPRRYFYPALNTLPYLKQRQAAPTAEDIASRVLCLPLYHDLSTESIKRICTIIAEVIRYK
jgi:dTDP-4-amino-4,6-dideoxygalactose transaminase